MLSFVLTLHQHVIYIHFYILPNLWTKHVVNQPLICCTCVLQTERHHLIIEQGLTGDKGCFLLICLVHPYLIVSRESIHKSKQLVTRSGIYQLVDVRQRVTVFGAGLV